MAGRYIAGAPAGRQVQYCVAVRTPDPLDYFPKQFRVIARLAGLRISNMNVNDRGAGSDRFNRRGCYLLWCNRDGRIFIDGIPGAGYGTSDNNFT